MYYLELRETYEEKLKTYTFDIGAMSFSIKTRIEGWATNCNACIPYKIAGLSAISSTSTPAACKCALGVEDNGSVLEPLTLTWLPVSPWLHPDPTQAAVTNFRNESLDRIQFLSLFDFWVHT